MLVEAYANSLFGNNVQILVSSFKDDNFDLSDKKCEHRPRKVEGYALQAFLDEDGTQS